MTLWLLLVAAALLSLERLCYVYVSRAPERFRRFCQRPVVASSGEPVEVLQRLFYGFKAIQFAVFLGWCYVHGQGSLSPTGSSILPLGIGSALIAFGQMLNYVVFYRLGKVGVFYGNKLGYDIPWSRAFPFSWLRHPQYVGTICSMCAEDFMSRRPHIDVIVQGGGSGVGISALLHGMVDVAMASRQLTTKEHQYADQQGLQIQTFDLAMDGIAVVVHPTNPVEAMTMQDLHDIFTGVRQSWQNAGGGPYPMTVFSRMDGSGTALLFRERVLDDKDDSGIAQQMPTNEAVVAEVAARLWAIGYTSFGAVQAARNRVKAVALQSSPQAPAVPLTPDTIRDRSYPLARILHLYTASEPTGVIRDFIDFCLSARGQELVRKAGYLAVTQ
jgi:phosphate transport system substrate-binding protein